MAESAECGVWVEYLREDNANITFENLALTNTNTARTPVHGTNTPIALQRGGDRPWRRGHILLWHARQRYEGLHRLLLTGAAHNGGLLGGNLVQSVDAP